MADYQATGRSTKSLSELLRDLIDQFSRIIRHEVGLAKAEMSEKVTQVGMALGMLAGSLVLAIAALVVLLFSAVYALGTVMDPWLSALIVGGVAALVAAMLVARGISRLKASSLAPTHTVESLRDNAEFVKEKAR